MVIIFFSSVESCEGDHLISSREKGVWPSSTKKKSDDRHPSSSFSQYRRVKATTASSREERVWPSSSKSERSITMAVFFHSLVKSCYGTTTTTTTTTTTITITITTSTCNSKTNLEKQSFPKFVLVLAQPLQTSWAQTGPWGNPLHSAY